MQKLLKLFHVCFQYIYVYVKNFWVNQVMHKIASCWFLLRFKEICGENISSVRLKDDPTPIMWLLSFPWKCLCQILCANLAEFCVLMCCFCLKLLYIYKITIMIKSSNFAITRLCLFYDTTFRAVIAKFTEKNFYSSTSLMDCDGVCCVGRHQKWRSDCWRCTSDWFT